MMIKNKTCKKCNASFVPKKKEEYCINCNKIKTKLKGGIKHNGNNNEKS